MMAYQVMGCAAIAVMPYQAMVLSVQTIHKVRLSL